MGNPSPHQRYLRDTNPTPPKPQHQGVTQNYGHPQNYPGESQRHHPLEAKVGVIYQLLCNECTHKYVGETGKPLKARMKQHKAAARNCYMSYH